MKVHKRRAIVRYMFFNPSDIKFLSTYLLIILLIIINNIFTIIDTLNLSNYLPRRVFVVRFYSLWVLTAI